VGWLALALLDSGNILFIKKKFLLIILDRSFLIFVHTFFTSIASFIIQITSFTTCNYFSKSRAFLLSLFVGASLSSSMWYSVFQVNLFIRVYLLI
jgi:hypothetical protein